MRSAVFCMSESFASVATLAQKLWDAAKILSTKLESGRKGGWEARVQEENSPTQFD